MYGYWNYNVIQPYHSHPIHIINGDGELQKKELITSEELGIIYEIKFLLKELVHLIKT